MAKDSEIRQWAQKLDKLLQNAAAARATENSSKIASAQRDFRKFKEDSPDYADALDTQATLAIFDLDIEVAEDAIAKIKERSAEVYRLTKLIEGVSEEANANADILSGKFAVEAIDAATSAISSFKKLRDTLSINIPDEKNIANEIDQTLTAIQALRSKLEKA